MTTALSGGKFLATYFGGTQGEVYLAAIRNGDSKLERGEIDRLVTRNSGRIDKFIAAHDQPAREAAIYFTTATLRRGEIKRVAANCWEFTSLFADIDDHGHELDRPRVIELLEGLSWPPTLIVNSGHGLQPHWLLDEPSQDFKRIEAARKRLHEITASDAVHDAPRFMRLPGSHNSKRGDWIPVEVVFNSERRYRLEALEQWLAEADVIIPRKLKNGKTNGAAQPNFVMPISLAPGTDRKRGEAWARAALDASCAELANAGEGSRHNTLRDKACRMGTMVARGWIDVLEVRQALHAAAQQCGQIRDYGEQHFAETFAAGIGYGTKNPHPDLSDNDQQQQPPRLKVAAAPPEIWRELVSNSVTECKRNDAAARLAGHLLRRYVDPRVALELVLAWNITRCAPPLAPAEITTIVNSIAKRELTRRQASR